MNFFKKLPIFLQNIFLSKKPILNNVYHVYITAHEKIISKENREIHSNDPIRDKKRVVYREVSIEKRFIFNNKLCFSKKAYLPSNQIKLTVFEIIELYKKSTQYLKTNSEDRKKSVFYRDNLLIFTTQGYSYGKGAKLNSIKEC